MKKLLLLLSVVSCVGGVWAMEGERKKATVHYAELADERIEIPAQVIELSRIMRDIVGKQEFEKAKRMEVGDELHVVLPLDTYIAGLKKIKDPVEALRLFVEYSAGKKSAASWSQEDLMNVILMADVLVATKSEEEHFTPRKDILAELLQALSLRIKKMLKSKEWVQDFLDGKGLLREMMEWLPTSVQDEFIRQPVGLSELFMDPVVLRGHANNVYSLIELKDGRLASGDQDGTIMMWKKGPDGTFVQEQVLPGHDWVVYSLIELKDGRLASGSQDKTIMMWKKGPGGKFEQEQVLRGHTGSVYSLIELQDGRLASGSSDKTIMIWKKGPDGKFVQEQVLRGHTGSVLSLIELQDGRLASGSADDTIMMWKKGPDGKFTKEQVLNNRGVKSLIELQDGRLASGSVDTTIMIWKKGLDGKFTKEQVLSGHEDLVNLLIELEDGRLASCSHDKTIRIWKKGPDGKFEQEQVLRGHTSRVLSLIELKDGRLASGSSDKTIMLWDIAPKSFAQSVVMKMLASGPELFEHKQSFFAKIKTYFVKTKPVVEQPTQEEEWYKKLFADELILNTFRSLPDASLHQIIELKGSKVVRIALEKLLDGIREDMEEEAYIDQHQKEIATRLEKVARLLKVLNLTEQEWELDPLVGYYKEAKKMAVDRKALQDEQRTHEKNEKVEKKEKPLLKEEVIEIEEKKSEKK